MATIDDLPVFEGQEYKVPYEIGSGSEGIVYALSKYFVIKIPHAVRISPIVAPYPISSYSADIIKSLENEYEIQKQLYESGVSVPKPEGIYLCEFPIFRFLPSRKRGPGLVMERVYGINKGRRYNKNLGNIIIKVKAELKKAMSLGFVPIDIGRHNVVYNPKLDKLWLVDFTGWRFNARDDCPTDQNANK